MTEEDKKKRDYKKVVDSYKQTIDQSLDECQRTDIPEPAYIHKVGDVVRYGAWNWTGILESFEGGKYFKCFSVTVNHNTNRGSVQSWKIHYLPWYEAGFRPEDLHDERFEEDEDVRFSYQQRDMISLLQMMFKDYGIDLEPEYQRGNVWNDQQKYNLIDSIFKNVDIGKFTIIRRPWGPDGNKPLTPKLYEMLDGKQRLTAVYEYYIGRFMYKGKYFYELHGRDQNHFKHFTINWAETEPLTKEQKYRYFLKLNTTGTPVDENHINKVRELWVLEKQKKSQS